MLSEAEVQAQVQIEGPLHGCILLRNNCGAFKDQTGRMVFYGLGNISKKQSEKIKSSDLIGFRRVVVTPEMVGQTIAVIVAIECKNSDWNPDKKLDDHEVAQSAFVTWIKAVGGYGGFANSVESFKRILGVSK